MGILEGRLYEKSLQLLSGADIQFHRSNRLDIAISTNMPVALVFLPAADIPRFVGEGRCALGITGVDQVAESQVEVTQLLDLAFGKCSLQVQVPDAGPINDVPQLIGKSIVSSFTHLTTEFFRKLENKSSNEPLDTTIKYVGGSVEAAVALGVADAIVDLVESGETMRAAGLRPIDTLLTTSAYLIGSKNPSPADKETMNIIISRISGVLAAAKYVLCTYNAPRSSLPELLTITPGEEAPTITALEEEGWVSVSSMVERSRIAEVMDTLTSLGAEDIIVFQMSNCRV